ncbi:PucR family transcriptional regulator [Nocardioides acrostichi]|uniref:Helix-turn-helix domain-containing protein n=1 Tax=Nocardioides acrostichi TaxID=2784339 RepID=A0A930V251_9ACTN|nr:PucR family transcriptional regulator [Nocardioides acrostichi]MBF4162644.1 helix-turn-helix domain-containing protein [Nocardioides acrostichi]
MGPETLDLIDRHRRERAAALADRLVELIDAGNPGYREMGVVPRDDLWRSCHDNIERVFALLLEQQVDATSTTDPAFEAARETGRRRAEQGLPLDDVLRSFRLGGRLIWDDLLAAPAMAEHQVDLLEVGSRLWQVVDASSAQVASAYHRFERERARVDAQQRTDLWEGLMSGRAADPGFAHRAAQILDLPDDGDFVAIVADQLDGTSAPGLLPGAWLRRGRDVVGLVLLTQGLAPVLQALHRVGQGAVGISQPMAGLAHGERAFEQAILAWRTLAGRPGVTSYGDRLPEALLLGSPSVAESLVQRWLAPVLARPRGEADVLVGTLEAWVACGGSAVATAAVAHCHRNTVVNRVRRVEALTGERLEEDRPPLELELALRAHRLQGTASR